MIRFVFLIWLGSLAAASAETLTRAYFVGKDQLWKWNVAENGLLNPSDEKDPFDGNTKPRIEVTPPQALEMPPFLSPLFRNGDTLYDFKTYKEQLKSIQGKLDRAIYNESTGRLVIRGEQITHHHFKSIAVAKSEQSPKTIELRLEFIQDHTPLLTISIQAIPGQKIHLKTGNGPHRIALDWEAALDAHSPIVESRIDISGTVRDQPFKFKTGLILIDGRPDTLTLGKAHPEQVTLQLKVTNTVLLPGDIPLTDLVLDEDGKSIIPPSGAARRFVVFEEGLPDPETGKTLRGYPVPPTFIEFLTRSNGSSATGEDPFAAEDDEPTKPQGIVYLHQWDPRIPAAFIDRMADCKQILRSSGIELGDSDFAVLNLETNTLFVLGSEDAHVLVDGIIKSRCSLPPRLIEANLKLIETLEKPTIGTLHNNHTVLAQASTIALPGQASTLTLGPMQLHLEPQIQANDSLIESRCSFQFIEGDKAPSYLFKSGLTFESGVPQIVQSTYTNGNWQSLIATATIQPVWDRAYQKNP